MIKLLTDLDKGEKGRITKILSGIESSASSVGHGHGIAKHFDQTLLKFERQTETPPNIEPRNVRRLKNMGVQVGKDLTVIAKQPFGPIVIEIDNIQTAIGRGMAHKIYVSLRGSVDRDQGE